MCMTKTKVSQATDLYVVHKLTKGTHITADVKLGNLLYVQRILLHTDNQYSNIIMNINTWRHSKSVFT